MEEVLGNGSQALTSDMGGSDTTEDLGKALAHALTLSPDTNTTVVCT